MRFFQKNINLFLMIVIIISVVAYAGSTIYYQETFQNITSTSQGVKSQYSTCQAKLDNTLDQLERTKEILNSTETDIKRYDTLYENKSAELSTTQTTLTKTKTDLTSYTQLYTKEKDRAESLSVEVTRVTKEKNTLSSENNALRLQVVNLQDDVSDLQDDVDDLQADLDTCEGGG